jgi:hypothetical protein
MPARPKPRDIVVVSVCGTVRLQTKAALLRFLPISGRRNLSQLAGSILESWVEENASIIPASEPDKRQMVIDLGSNDGT